MAKEKKVTLRLKKYHSNGFRIGRHVVKMGKPQEFELNEAELAELETTGPKHWIEQVEAEPAKKPRRSAKPIEEESEE